MLKTEQVKYYRVKEGQGVREIAEYFSVSPYLLARCNGLYEEPSAGVILEIPTQRGNFYTVQAGDTKTLLCGSEERYNEINRTTFCYPGLKIFL